MTTSCNNDPFSARSADWDQSPRRLRLASNVLEALQRQVPLKPSWNVLEAGCGTGLVTLPLSLEVNSILAIDPSRDMLSVLETKTRGRNTITIRQTDLLELGTGNCPEAPFDCVFSSMTLHHIDDTAQALETMAGLLAPGGWLAIADLDSEDGFFHDDAAADVHHGFCREKITAMIENAGLHSPLVTTAATIDKTNRAGKQQAYTVFLATARK